MPRDGFIATSSLLTEASHLVEEAARAVLREASRAPLLVTPIDQDYGRQRVDSPDEMHADALTKLALEMSHTANTLKDYGKGFGESHA